MHILELPSFFPPYGGEFCIEQARALLERGHEVRILSVLQLSIKHSRWQFFTYPYKDCYEVREGVEVIRSYTRGIPKVIRPNVNRWVAEVQRLFDVYVRKYGLPDVIHAHCAKWAGYAAMLISQTYGIPYVITEHLSIGILKPEFDRCGGMQAWQIPMLKQAYQRAQRVFPVAAELVDSIACYFGKEYHWAELSNAIDTQIFTYSPRNYTSQRSFRFCCVANFVQLKGYDVLLPAFDRLCDLGYDVKLDIIGRDTDSAAFLRMVSNCKYAHRIQAQGLLHSKSQVAAFFHQQDALVLPSRSEVQPLVLIEAMSTGIPVITTTVAPQSLRLEGGCTIIPVDDEEALTRAMEATLQHYSSFDGKALSQRVEQLFSPAVFARRMETYLQECVSANAESSFLLSIIIPYYNIDSVLVERCLKSLLQQSWGNVGYEILLVDDGSTLPIASTTLQLLASFPNHQLIRQPNGGLGAARNRGLEEARGTYVVFLDPDDYWYPMQSFPSLLACLRMGKYDIISYRLHRVFTLGIEASPCDAWPSTKFCAFASGSEYMSQHNLPLGACTSFYRLRLLRTHQILMPEGLLHEDEAFVPMVYLHSGLCLVTDWVLYAYYQRPNSIMSRRTEAHWKRSLQDFHTVMTQFQNRYRLKDESELSSLQLSAVARKLSVYALDYLYNLMQSNLPMSYIKTQIEQLKKEGLYPLKPKNFTLKQQIFALVAQRERLFYYLCASKRRIKR